MKTMALICARGGSKGLPGKNIRLLGGKPLIAWAIEQSLELASVERVIVSTDSNEIASIATKYGAEVPFMRPAELAMDDSPEWLVWRHALNHVFEHDGSYPDVLLVVPTTAPLRSSLDLRNCLEHYQQNDFDTIITVTDAHRNPYFNMVSVLEDGTAELVISPEVDVSRRQDAPHLYDMTTVCYVTSPGFVMNYSGIFEGRVGSVFVPADRAIDIDTALDLKIAQYLISER